MLTKHIKKAVKIINTGGIVAFPTDTVYGLGCDATNSISCQKLFRLKKRNPINPLIIHVSSLKQASCLAYINDDAKKLAHISGPITMVLRAKPNNNIAKEAVANLDTIAIRIPNSYIIKEIIKQSKKPIAAPSANISGLLTSTSYINTKQHFKNQLYIIPEFNMKNCGIESTVIDLTTKTPILLRPGYILKTQLSEILKKEVKSADEIHIIKSPGMLTKHYQTKAPLRINAEELFDNEIGLDFGQKYKFKIKYPNNFSLNLSEKECLKEATYNLFNYLNQLDIIAQKKNKSIAVAPIMNKDHGIAINNRLKRAAKSS